MKTVLAFDPGAASGWFYGWYNSTEPLTKIDAGIIVGGPQALSDWVRGFLYEHGQPDHVVSELFVPDGSPGGRLTVSPRGEGVLIAHFDEDRISFQKRGEKAWGYDSQKQTDDKLKELGLWTTGSQVGHTDGRDSNDATIHAYQFMRKMRHRPTLAWIYGEAPATD